MAHKSEVSQFCTFASKSKEYMKMIRESYFVAHPEAKAEYDKIYLGTITKCSTDKRREVTCM